MESENKTVQLPQTSLGMHNLIIDLTVHLNQINPGLSWDLDPHNLMLMAAAAEKIRNITDYCEYDQEYDDMKESDPELIKKIDDAYGAEKQ